MSVTPLLASIGASLLFVPGLLPILRLRGVLDLPNDRSSHAVAVPRGGGLAVIAAALVAVGITSDVSRRDVQAVAVVILGFGLLGLTDDLKNGLSVGLRLFAALALGGVGTFLALEVPSPPLATGAGLVVGTIWIAGFTNSFNFMDGINGISGLHGAVIGTILAVAAAVSDLQEMAAVSLALSGACIGFLPYNWLRARVFLGDVGSYGIGSGLAAVAFLLWLQNVPFLACVGAMVPYLTDTTSTVVRRILRREPFYEAHREHAYQRLCDRGISHARTAAFVAAASASTGVLGLLTLIQAPLLTPAALVLGALVTLAYLRSPECAKRCRPGR